MQILSTAVRRPLLAILSILTFCSMTAGFARAELQYQNGWTVQPGTAASDCVYGTAADRNGNVYIAGYTAGSLDGNVTAGGYDLFVSKYNSAGTRQWTRQMGTTGTDVAYGVAVDSKGNVVVAGCTNGALDGKKNAGGYDLFVVRYNASGVKLWSKLLGTTLSDYAQGVCTDAADNIYVAGYTSGDLDGKLNASKGSADLFVVKYNKAGTKLWSAMLGTTGNDYAYGITSDTAGNIFVAGCTNGGLDGNANLGGYDLFAVKYTAAGAKVWTNQLGGPGTDYAFGVTADSAGDIYVAGHTNGAVGAANAGGFDILLVKYNPAVQNTTYWVRQLGSTAGDYANCVSTDAYKNAYVAGFTHGGLDGKALIGGADAFVVKYDPAGAKLWSRQLGTAAVDKAYGVCTDPTGNVNTAGYTAGAFGGASKGGYDAFLNKLISDPDTVITTPLTGTALPGTKTTIKGTASATNGVAAVEVSTDGGLTWLGATGTSPWSFNWTFPGTGVFNIQARATDSLANLEQSCSSIDVTVTGTSFTFKCLPVSPQVNGTPITWTATITSGVGPYIYKFWRKGPDTAGAFVVAKDWSGTNTWTWTPTAAEVGANTVMVYVKDAANTVSASKVFTVQ